MGSHLLIRAADITDVPELARVHVESWRETYRGLMSAEILDDPDFIPRRERFWTAALTNERFGNNSIAIATLDGRVVGVAMSGPPLDDDATWAKQLYVLYTYAAVHGQGAGSALLDAVLEPRDIVSLWVAEPNPRAQAFYRRHGFMFDGTSKVADGLQELRMIREPRPSY